MTMIDVFGVRVRQARMLRRMTSKAVLTELGWKGARQTRLEQAEITSLVLVDFERLVEVLRFPPTFFTTAPTTRVSAGDLLFRAPKSTTAGEKEHLAQFAALAGDFLDDLNARWQLPPVKLPTLSPSTAVDIAAAQTRSRMGFTAEEPIPYLMYEVERSGVPVISRLRRSKSSRALDWEATSDDGAGVSEKHLGYSIRVGEFGERPLVVLRASDSWERTRWTLAHELGHLVLHSGSEVAGDQEEQASRFASELLAPSTAIAKEIPRVPSLLNLMPLKLKWGISIGALLRHMFESNLIDSIRYDMLRRQLYTRKNPQTGHTWGKTEPGWDDREVERPRLLARWVERCYGATSAQMLAPYQLIWPQDLLDDFLAGQRSAPQGNAHPTATTEPPSGSLQGRSAVVSNVVDFDRFRQRRQA